MLNDTVTYGELTAAFEVIVDHVCDPVKVEEEPATCTAGGMEEHHKCEECGVLYDADGNEITEESLVIPATGHSFTKYESNGDATCTEDGTKTAKCDNDGCSETDTRTEVGSATDHSFTKYESNGDATCTADGTETATCDNDGCSETDTRTEVGSATGHSFTDYVSNGDATCTADGTKTAKCDNCDATDKVADEGSATGHSFTKYESNGDATCTADGTKTAKCDNCDAKDTVTDEGSKKDHTYEWVIDKAATTEEAGVKHEECTVCHDKRNENTEIPKLEDSKPVDKTALQKEVDAAEVLNEDDYTAEAWAVFARALEEVNAVLADEDATQEEVDAALAEFKAAREALKPVLKYVDVKETDWFYDAVYYNYVAKTMTGLDDTHFGPYESLSRAQFALILYRIEGEPEVKTEKTFADISGDEWYGQAVLWAAEAGIVTGYENGCYGPADMITREQMAVMMYRYAKYLKKDVSKVGDISEFLDVDSVSPFAADAFAWANGMGIITGKENGTILAPQANTARAEAAAIIERYMNAYTE